MKSLLILLSVDLLGGFIKSGLCYRNSVLPMKSRYRDNEFISAPPMVSNAIPGEPSCEELRAMWRYYKRQSRAEFTNEVPRFGSHLFWPDPHISSFAHLKARSKGRLRGKAGGFGRILYKPSKSRGRRPPRPLDQVAKLIGRNRQSKVGGGEAIVHLAPTPTKASSFQQLRDILKAEKQEENGPSQTKNNEATAFGRIVLSPQKGDGRVANKPKELMTPFEKIRFGHADHILDDSNNKPILKRSSLFDYYIQPDMEEMRVCEAVEGKPCSQNTECACVGFGLYRCYMNQCQVLSFTVTDDGFGSEDDEGFWHSEPLDSSALGVWTADNLDFGDSVDSYDVDNGLATEIHAPSTTPKSQPNH